MDLFLFRIFCIQLIFFKQRDKSRVILHVIIRHILRHNQDRDADIQVLCSAINTYLHNIIAKISNTLKTLLNLLLLNII